MTGRSSPTPRSRTMPITAPRTPSGCTPSRPGRRRRRCTPSSTLSRRDGGVPGEPLLRVRDQLHTEPLAHRGWAEPDVAQPAAWAGRSGLGHALDPAPAPAHPGTGEMAGKRNTWACRLLRGSRQHRRRGGVPRPGDEALASRAIRRLRRSVRARAAISARSAQDIRGRAVWRCSTASWWRSTRISTSLSASDRAIRTIQLTMRQASRYVSRSPIKRILPGADP
jgi:hypothetical protein